MVGHDIIVHGVNLAGVEQKTPVILQMHDDDFPGRFLQDLASPSQPQISSAVVVNTSSQQLYQPVQRLLNVAMVELSCDTLSYPRVDPTRIISAGLVIRRCYRVAGPAAGTTTDEFDTLSAWMRSPQGTYSWVKLSPNQENWDPDPTKRPQLQSGQAALDQQLAALSLSAANTESATPAFAAPPAICAALGRTVFYGVIPTASSEMSDTPPAQPPQFDTQGLINSLPGMLLSGSTSTPVTPLPGATIDYRWLSDDFLYAMYPPSPPTSPNPLQANPSIPPFHVFTTALRMLDSVFNAFNGSSAGNQILSILNRHNVTVAGPTAIPMGSFYQQAKLDLLDYNAYPSSSAGNAPTVTMPTAWDWLDDDDQNDLISALVTALGAAAATPGLNVLSPQGRFQDGSRYYKLRMFFRIKPESGNCPPKLVWSQYSHHFQIAPWYATGPRTHAPIPLPDPTSGFLQNAKPNCAFQVPASLMNAMQATSMTGLMNGAGGGSGVGLGWICGFNIPLITICAFFVLNIFLSLLNIVFFWLPFIKICIPFPAPSSSDGGSP